MDPISLLVVGGAVGALSSLVSAVSSYILRRRAPKVKLKIGDQEIEMSTSNRAEVKKAVERLQQVLDADTATEA